MKERSLGIILGILNIVLFMVCGFFFLGKDKNAPEILLPKASIVYAEEAGTDSLFEGVTAFDEEDGELTGSVVIEKIVTNDTKETATITYGVADSSGNVGKVTCTVDMVTEDVGGIAEGENIPEAEVEEDGTPTDEAEEKAASEGQAEGAAALEGLAENTDSDGEEENVGTDDDANNESEEENAESNDDMNSDSEEGDAEAEADSENEEENAGADDDVNSESEEENAESDGDSDEVNEAEGTADSQEEETTEEEQAEEDNREALPTAGEAGNAGQNVSSGQSSGRPGIVFKDQEIKAKAGSGPAWVNVIGSLDDDKDNYGVLFKTLKIHGTYDKNTAGTYDVTVTVTDSDGNESDPYPMKIIVEE